MSPPPPPLAQRVDERIDALVHDLLAHRREDGSWASRVVTNASHTALHFLALHYLDAVDLGRQADAVHAVLRRQAEDGGWPAERGDGPSSPSLTVRCYASLRLAGLGEEHPALRRAERLVRRGHGMERLDLVSRTFLAFLGLYPFDGIPLVPATAVVLGDRHPWLPGVGDLGAILRGGVLAYAYLHGRRAVRPRAGGYTLLRRLYREPPAAPAYRFHPPGGAYRAASPALWAASIVPGRLAARVHGRLVRDVADLQEASGLFGGTAQTTALNLMALDHANDDGRFDAHLARGRRAFGDLLRRDGREAVAVPFTSATWDTAQVARALAATGRSDVRPAIDGATRWLLAKQTSSPGYWSHGAPGVAPGGWAFDETNTLSPDTDTTQAVLRALASAPSSAARDAAVGRGVAWERGLQSPGGGWAAFGRERGRFGGLPLRVARECMPLVDAPAADLTALVLGALAPARDEAGAAIAAGLGFLRRTQARDGSWPAAWGVNHVYATAHAVEALARLRQQHAKWALRARHFLLRVQGPDGGWGESVLSYRRGRYVRGPSTVVLSATVVQALVAAGASTDPAVSAAVRFLFERTAGATPETPEYAGVLSPGAEYYGLDLLPSTWALKALAEWRRAT